jgi:hypothetical protein
MKMAANIVRDAGGEVVGRTRLQKTAYLLELAGLGSGFEFEYRHYGPYSEQLATAVSNAATLRLLSEDEKPTNWGGFYSVFRFTAHGGADDAAPARVALIREAANAGPVALELAATAAFLAAEGVSDPWKETERRKPEKAAKSLEDAKTLYRSLLKISTPEPLPAI